MATLKDSNQKNMDKVMEFITLKLKESKKLPWLKPWKSSGIYPQNYVTKHRYTGMNYFITALCENDYPFFLTFLQMKKLGGKLNKNFTSIPITLWKPIYYLNKKSISIDQYKNLSASDKSKANQIFILKLYYVYNIADISGIEFELPKVEPKNHTLINDCEKLVNSFAKNLNGFKVINSDRAFYRPIDDLVTIPLREQFSSIEAFYMTTFHEFAHSTGHKDRLDRFPKTSLSFGNESYSKEELTAELTASLLGEKYGIFDKTKENNAAYIQGWLKQLQDNPEYLLEASKHAQKAYEYIVKAI